MPALYCYACMSSASSSGWLGSSGLKLDYYLRTVQLCQKLEFAGWWYFQVPMEKFASFCQRCGRCRTWIHLFCLSAGWTTSQLWKPCLQRITAAERCHQSMSQSKSCFGNLLIYHYCVHCLIVAYFLDLHWQFTWFNGPHHNPSAFLGFYRCLHAFDHCDYLSHWTFALSFFALDSEFMSIIACI